METAHVFGTTSIIHNIKAFTKRLVLTFWNLENSRIVVKNKQRSTSQGVYSSPCSSSRYLSSGLWVCKIHTTWGHWKLFVLTTRQFPGPQNVERAESTDSTFFILCMPRFMNQLLGSL